MDKPDKTVLDHKEMERTLKEIFAKEKEDIVKNNHRIKSQKRNKRSKQWDTATK